jgi:hypothetical protein
MKTYAIISTLAALVLLALLLPEASPIRNGGGQGETSPNGLCFASASSLRNLGRRHTYYEFTVAHVAATSFKRVVMFPTENIDPMYFRHLPPIMEWAPDSSRVTFSIPGIVLKLDVQDHSP